MQVALRPWITAGLALAGSGVIAAIPTAVSAHDTQAAEIQLVNTTDPLTAWIDLFKATDLTFATFMSQLPDLLGGRVAIPDTLTAETLLSHAPLYPVHNLGQIVTDQFNLLQSDLTGGDPTAFITDLLAAPAVELNAVLNGVGLVDYNDGLRGLLNPFIIGPGDENSQGTFSNLAAVIGEHLGPLINNPEGLAALDLGL